MSCQGDDLYQWFRSELGCQLAEQEAEKIAELTNTLPGIHYLQVGSLGDGKLLPKNPRVISALVEPFAREEAHDGIIADAANLPFLSESMDIVVLLHTLEFAENPHQVLREAERVTASDGYLILVGFNPASLWGIAKVLNFARNSAPWAGHFFTRWRLVDWFHLLGMDVCDSDTLFARPPTQRTRLLQRLSWMERRLLKRLPWMGGVYVLKARKRLIPVNPIRAKWSRPPAFSGIVQPTPRQVGNWQRNKVRPIK